MPHPVDVMFGMYLRACMTYGLQHSIPYAYTMKIPLINDGTDDVWLADRVDCCVIGAGVAPAFWPVFLYEDARAIERFVRRRA
jgi:hypothetical protein